MTRHVALYLPSLEGGGAEKMMAAIATGLAARGMRVDLVLARAHGTYLAEVSSGVNIVDLDSRGVLASLPRLRRYLARERPEAVLGTLPYANLALLWTARSVDRRIRVYLREATTPSVVESGTYGRKTRAIRKLTKLFYPRAEGVVAVSEGVAQDLREFVGVPAHKVVTIFNPVVSQDLLATARAPVSHPWLEPGGPPLLLSVGRLGREKGFDTLLRAFALLRARRPARLLILGEGKERARLEELVRELGLEGDVSLPGFVEQPVRYMARASAYVLSSRREGLPGALIQAMAAGCPVVATDCPSGPAEVLNGGEYGPLVPVDNPERLAEGMTKVLDSPLPAGRLRERSMLFSEERSIAAYLRLLEAGPQAAASLQGGHATGVRDVVTSGPG